MDKRYLLLIDSILVLGSLLTVFFIVGYTQPLVIGDFEQDEPMIILPKSNYLLIDNNIKFDSPRTLFLNETFEILPGKYFIKVGSDVRELEVQTKITVEIREFDSSLALFNSGEETLEIETYKIGSLVNSSISLGENG